MRTRAAYIILSNKKEYTCINHILPRARTYSFDSLYFTFLFLVGVLIFFSLTLFLSITCMRIHSLTLVDLAQRIRKTHTRWTNALQQNSSKFKEE